MNGKEFTFWRGSKSISPVPVSLISYVIGLASFNHGQEAWIKSTAAHCLKFIFSINLRLLLWCKCIV